MGAGHGSAFVGVLRGDFPDLIGVLRGYLPDLVGALRGLFHAGFLTPPAPLSNLAGSGISNVVNGQRTNLSDPMLPSFAAYDTLYGRCLLKY